MLLRCVVEFEPVGAESSALSSNLVRLLGEFEERFIVVLSIAGNEVLEGSKSLISVYLDCDKSMCLSSY